MLPLFCCTRLCKNNGSRPNPIASRRNGSQHEHGAIARIVQWLSPHARSKAEAQYCGGTNCSGKWSARMSTYRFTSPGAMGEGEVEPDATVIRVVHASDLLCRCQGKGSDYHRFSNRASQRAPAWLGGMSCGSPARAPLSFSLRIGCHAKPWNASMGAAHLLGAGSAATRNQETRVCRVGSGGPRSA